MLERITIKMKGNEDMENTNEMNLEKEAVKKEEARLQEERQREEQKRVEEKVRTDRQNQERQRKESERRRREQNDRKEHLKQVEEMRALRAKEQADREVGGGKGEQGRRMEQHLIRGRQLDIQANKEGRGAKQTQQYRPQEQREMSKALEKLRNFEKTVEHKIEDKEQKQNKEMERTR